MRDEDGFNCCDICLSFLDEDGTCAICAYQEELYAIEEDEYDDDDAFDEFVDDDCHCPICDGEPNRDIFFIYRYEQRHEYEYNYYEEDDDGV